MAEMTKYYIQSGHSIPYGRDGQVKILEPDGKPLDDKLVMTMGNKRIEKLIAAGVLSDKPPVVKDVDKSASGGKSVKIPQKETLSFGKEFDKKKGD